MLKLSKHPTVISRFKRTLSVFFLHTATAPNSPLKLHSLIKKCSSMKQLKALQALIITGGLAGDAVTVSKLISFCALSASGDLQYAHYVFEKMPQPNRHIYNTLIRAFSCRGNSGKAMFLYQKMFRCGIWPNEFTFPFVLKVCAFQKAKMEGVCHG